MSTPTCECGVIIGDYCSSEEPADVSVIFVAESDRGSVLAACNGVVPSRLGGLGQRLLLSRACADLLCDDSDPWVAFEEVTP